MIVRHIDFSWHFRLLTQLIEKNLRLVLNKKEFYFLLATLSVSIILQLGSGVELQCEKL